MIRQEPAPPRGQGGDGLVNNFARLERRGGMLHREP